MQVSPVRLIYNATVACCALAVAFFAMVPVSATTASAIGVRGGQAFCPGGCHDVSSTCSGDISCLSARATACVAGEQDTNNETCSPDTKLCSYEGCGGEDSVCGGR